MQVPGSSSLVLENKSRNSVNARRSMCLFILTILLLVSNTSGSSVNGIEEISFKPTRICGTANDLIVNNCCTTPSRSRRIRSSLKCAVECGKHSTCLGSFMDDTGTCRFLKLCDYAWANMNCDLNGNDNAADFIQIPRKRCYNGGFFTRKKDVVCQCNRGMIGDFCTIRASGCEQLVGYGYDLGVNYIAKLLMASKTIVTVRCKIFLDRTITGLFCNTGKHNHTTSWKNYENGYSLDKTDYWLGLQNMHAVTNTNRTTIVQWCFYFWAENSKTGSLYKVSDAIYYYGFRVGQASDGYSYTFESVQMENDPSAKGIETPMGDCLNDTQNVPFSTWDNDNDQEPEVNRARLSNAGWWFKSRDTSLACNPLGMSVKTLAASSPNGHIAIKNLDMINSFYGQTFRRVDVKLIVLTP